MPLRSNTGCLYLSLSVSSTICIDEYARKFAFERRISEGLVCILIAVEACQSFKDYGARHQIQ